MEIAIDRPNKTPSHNVSVPRPQLPRQADKLGHWKEQTGQNPETTRRHKYKLSQSPLSQACNDLEQ